MKHFFTDGEAAFTNFSGRIFLFLHFAISHWVLFTALWWMKIKKSEYNHHLMLLLILMLDAPAFKYPDKEIQLYTLNR